jgi:transcription elongation factor GreB
MSRAFVKEDDASGDAELPLPQRDHPNYMTPAGFAALQSRLQQLYQSSPPPGTDADLEQTANDQQRRREIRLTEWQLQTAQVIAAPAAPVSEVRFGAWVSLRDPSGTLQTIRIVGADEVCIERGEVSWVSPLAHALLGRSAGDSVIWERPDGLVELEVVEVRYAP